MRALGGLALMSLLALAASGCVAQSQGTDHYSRVAPFCMKQVPGLGEYDALNGQTYLNADNGLAECKSALEGEIPYDRASFATAPTGMMDKVTEAFQSMIAYPMAVDYSDISYMGVHPRLAGAISPFVTDIYSEWPNPNQAIFNYILDHTDVIKYGGDNSSIDAQYMPAVSTQPRQITIFHGFYQPDAYWIDSFRMPFLRASTLAHEARHGDSILHDVCQADQTGVNGGFECDNELAGAYGFAGVYLKYLLHGSATCSTPGCQAPMDDFSIQVAGWYMCVVARSRVNHRFDELDKLVGIQADPIDDDFCGNNVNYDWILHQEGIPYPPECPFGTVPDGNGGCKSGFPPPPIGSSGAGGPATTAAAHARSATDGSKPLSSYGPRLWGHRCDFHQNSP